MGLALAMVCAMHRYNVHVVVGYILFYVTGQILNLG